MGKTLFEKVWDAHVVAQDEGAPAILVYRRAPDPRSDLAAGVCDAARAWAEGAPAGQDLCHDGPRHPHAQHGHLAVAAGCGDAGAHAARELRGVRHHAVGHQRPHPGHRARGRAGDGRHAAGHDHRLRRQPHQHARRLWRAGLWHRHQRSGPRAGHASACCRRSPRPLPSPSTANWASASRPRTSSWPSSPRTARAAAQAMSSSTAAAPSAS